MSDYIEIETSNLGEIPSPIKTSFQLDAYNNTYGIPSKTSVNVAGGNWGTYVFPDVEDIGDKDNCYIVADKADSTIKAQSSAPTETTKRLIAVLEFETYVVQSEEYPDNPSYEGTKVLTGWHQYQVGDINTGDPFPWDIMQFGWIANGTLGPTILAGSIIKSSYTPVGVSQTPVTISNYNVPTYIGLQVRRDMSSPAIIQGTSEPVSDSTRIRVWFYIFQRNKVPVVPATDPVTYVESLSLLRVNLGQIMNVDISGYGD